VAAKEVLGGLIVRSILCLPLKDSSVIEKWP
jgi:hypothetical protein